MKLSFPSLTLLVVASVTATGSMQIAACGGDSNNTGGASSSTAGPGGMGSGGTPSGGGGAGGNASGAGGGGAPQTGPFPGDPGTWTFQPIDGSKCMNGTDTGIGTNTTNNDDNVFIYLEGGNACFNTLSCSVTANADGYGPTEFATEVTKYLGTPLFERSVDVFKDYNFVYIPYCTGDVHAGDNDTTVAGTMRHFHGAHNMDLYFARIKSAFPHAKKIVISGSSAGGFGAAFNYDRAAKAFPNVKVALVDDSGPPMAEAFVPPCLQKLFRQTWGLSKTLPADCTDCNSDDPFMEPLVAYITSQYSDRRLSIISSSEDATISQFWGFGYDSDPMSATYGQPNCMTAQTVPYPYPGSEYAMGLQDLRGRIVGDQPNFKMFLIDGTNGEDKTHHVWLDQDTTMVMSNDVSLETFLEQQLGGDANWANVGLP